MATIKAGALKIITPSNLPKNEKDLICMLLAGRLKDLWNGRLVCFELAVDDLIKDTIGSSPLDNMREALGKLKDSLNGFKEQSGYDKILNDVNNALGKLGDVFSLGGLCPSPITTPRIPDVLGQLNVNLFGQANNILNALGKVANPAVCLGGGPAGIGVDWNSMPGSLAQLKYALNAFKNDPAGFASVMKAFENNIKGQVNRLNAELARLKQNLADPLGIQNKRTTVGNLQRTKKSSDSWPVMDRNGVVHKNIAATMTTAEMQNIMNRTDPLSTTPVMYELQQELDYCGEVVGLRKVVVSGDPVYLPYDTYYDNLNNPGGTSLPRPTYANFDFYFTDDSGALVVYDTFGNELREVNIERGMSYAIGFDLAQENLILTQDGTAWTDDGVQYLDFTYVPATSRQGDITVNFKEGELTWIVRPEEMANVSTLFFNSTTASGAFIQVNVSGTTVNENKTYDLANLVKKSLMHTKNNTLVQSGISVPIVETNTDKIYKQTITVINELGNTISTTTNLPYSNDVGYSVIQDKEIDTTTGTIDENKKILKSTQHLGNDRYLISKLHFTDIGSLEITQMNLYVSTDIAGEIHDENYMSCFVKYNDSIFITNDGILTSTKSVTEYYSWMAVYMQNGEVVYSTKDTAATGFFTINEPQETITLTMNSGSIDSLLLGDLLMTFEFKLRETYDTTIDRTFEGTNPYINKWSIIAKGPGSTKIEITQEKV